MFHLTKWDLDKRSQTLHKEQLYQGSGKYRNPGKHGKNSVFCDTQGKPGKLRELEIDF